MRITIVTESFLPEVNGVAVSVLRVLEHLRRRGHSALVIAPGRGPDTHDGTPVVRVPTVELATVGAKPLGVPTRRLFAAMSDFRPDVVHLASPFVLGAGGLAAAKRLRVPSVAVFQTDVAGFATAYGLGFAARAAWRWTRRLHQQADRTLAPSSAAADALSAHGIPRVHRWGRGVDGELFHPRSRSAELRSQLAPNGEVLVGYVGRLSPEKQVERLAVLQRIPGMRVVVVGDGPSRADLERTLPDAAFLGMLHGADLARAYATLDVFVHTGPFETFCQTVQEAMAAGVPVVAPDRGGPRDLVDHGRTGFLVSTDDAGAELRAAVTRLVDEPVRRRAFGAAGRRVVGSRSWPVVCEELLGHYAQVMQQPLGRDTAA